MKLNVNLEKKINRISINYYLQFFTAPNVENRNSKNVLSNEIKRTPK